MRYRNYSRFPERMVALSILPPPLALDRPAPFGFGAFIVTRRWRDEAEFASYAHGYGAGYEYDHASTEAFSGQNYFPDELARQRFYTPSDRGFERELAERLDHWVGLRGRAQSTPE